MVNTTTSDNGYLQTKDIIIQPINEHEILAGTVQEYTDLGLVTISIEWNTAKNEPVCHVQGWDKATQENNPFKLKRNHNALMIRTWGCWGCLDIDLKNTARKDLFDLLYEIILHERPDLAAKLYIEQTRNKGFHVWLKYRRLTKKLALAASEQGAEVIALYACGPLVYTYPTPGYSVVKNSMYDVSELTNEEFEYLMSLCQWFNEYKPGFDPQNKAISYPEGWEWLLKQFDTNLPDEAWEQILSEVGLIPYTGFKYQTQHKFRAYKRAGSTGDYIGAKVYFQYKRLMIFSASMSDFPNWHNRQDYPIWSLPPSFVLFYKNKRDWNTTIEEIKAIMDSAGMDNDFEPIAADNNKNYPMDVFPDEIRISMQELSAQRNIPVQFTATAALWTVSSLAGTRYSSDFNGDARNILFCLLVAPMSVGKTPAFKAMCEYPLRYNQESADRLYETRLQQWEAEKLQAHAEKKGFVKKRPVRYMPFSNDGTTEAYVSISMFQKNGIGVYQDEAETIFNAGSFKNTNDSISFFTQAFTGGRVTQLRVDDTKTRVVPNLNLNLLMGTQSTRLKNIFTEDRLESGFASRFLMVESNYMPLDVDADPFSEKKEMCIEWVSLVNYLYEKGNDYNLGNADKVKIDMPGAAKNLYRVYYKQILHEANSRIASKEENYVIGTEAKMTMYFPRLVQVLAILYKPNSPEITEDLVHKAWTLYKFYAGETIRIISGLHGEIETGLPKELERLYQALPESFTRKEAVEICKRNNINERRFDVSMRRKDFAGLFLKLEHGSYKKR